jgi:hypothetical protein
LGEEDAARDENESNGDLDDAGNSSDSSYDSGDSDDQDGLPGVIGLPLVTNSYTCTSAGKRGNEGVDIAEKGKKKERKQRRFNKASCLKSGVSITISLESALEIQKIVGDGALFADCYNSDIMKKMFTCLLLAGGETDGSKQHGNLHKYPRSCCRISEADTLTFPTAYHFRTDAEEEGLRVSRLVAVQEVNKMKKEHYPPPEGCTKEVSDLYNKRIYQRSKDYTSAYRALARCMEMFMHGQIVIDNWSPPPFIPTNPDDDDDDDDVSVVDAMSDDDDCI